MPPRSPTAREVARHLLSRAKASGEHDPTDSVAALDPAFRVLAIELSRWFGPYAYHALIARALAETQGEHPPLTAVRLRSPTEPWLEGLPEAAGVHGSTALAEAGGALLAGLIDLLGRLIGMDLAVNLVSKAMMNHPPMSRADSVPDTGGTTESGTAT